MKSEPTLYARIESTVWEALEENDLYMKLSEREKLTSELLRIVKDQQAEAWNSGFDAGERDALDLDENPDHECIQNPYR